MDKKKSLKRNLYYYQVFTFIVVCMLLYKLLIVFRERYFFKGFDSSHSNIKIKKKKKKKKI